MNRLEKFIEISCCCCCCTQLLHILHIIKTRKRWTPETGTIISLKSTFFLADATLDNSLTWSYMGLRSSIAQQFFHVHSTTTTWICLGGSWAWATAHSGSGQEAYNSSGFCSYLYLILHPLYLALYPNCIIYLQQCNTIWKLSSLIKDWLSVYRNKFPSFYTEPLLQATWLFLAERTRLW